MRKLGLAIGLSVAALVGACGGGGGSPGETNEAYSITLRTDKKQLPINISHHPAGAGAYAPYTTTLYVEAREGNKPIPGGEDIFGCNIVQGFESGALYYLDGDDEHEDEDGNPAPYRAVVLGSNSGAATFHFHASDKAGTARVLCSVTNPRDRQVSSAAVDIVVGANTGMPASVIAFAQDPGFLGSQNNANNIRNSVGIQAFVMDDANQPVPNPANGVANLRVEILNGGAAAGARIMAGSQPYTNQLDLMTNGGVGLFSLASGPARGVILLRFTSDRNDNNITNGIQDPVYQLMAVDVADAIATEPLTVAAPSAALTATNGTAFAYALVATGGIPPYAWEVSGALPAGLAHNGGVISGTPKAQPGEYSVSVKVTDQRGATATATVKIAVTGDLPLDPLVIAGCTSDVNTACRLPNASRNQAYRHAFSATGGDPEEPITWDIVDRPSWLTATVTGNTYVLAGTPSSTSTPPTACGTYNFFVTASRGTMTVTRQMSIEVVGTTTTPCTP